MIKVSKIKKVFAVILAFAIGCLSFGSSARAQIWLEDQSDDTTLRIIMTFENQDDVDDMIIGVNSLIGKIRQIKINNKGVTQIKLYQAWISDLGELFSTGIGKFLPDNMALRICLCKAFSKSISNNLKMMGDGRFVMVEHSTIIDNLEEFIKNNLGEEAVNKFVSEHGFPYKITITALKI